MCLRITEQARCEGVSFMSRWGQARAAYAPSCQRDPTCTHRLEENWGNGVTGEWKDRMKVNLLGSYISGMV